MPGPRGGPSGGQTRSPSNEVKEKRGSSRTNKEDCGESTEEGAGRQEVDPEEVASELSVKMVGVHICTRVTRSSQINHADQSATEILHRESSGKWEASRWPERQRCSGNKDSWKGMTRGSRNPHGWSPHWQMASSGLYGAPSMPSRMVVTTG